MSALKDFIIFTLIVAMLPAMVAAFLGGACAYLLVKAALTGWVYIDTWRTPL